MPKHLTIRIYGRVQGVFFRETAEKEAQRLGLKGFVRNEPRTIRRIVRGTPDKSVYIEVEGEEENLAEFLTWCRKGPDLAGVKKLESKEGKFRNFTDFSVL